MQPLVRVRRGFTQYVIPLLSQSFNANQPRVVVDVLESALQVCLLPTLQCLVTSDEAVSGESREAIARCYQAIMQDILSVCLAHFDGDKKPIACLHALINLQHTFAPLAALLDVNSDVPALEKLRPYRILWPTDTTDADFSACATPTLCAIAQSILSDENNQRDNHAVVVKVLTVLAQRDDLRPTDLFSCFLRANWQAINTGLLGNGNALHRCFKALTPTQHVQMMIAYIQSGKRTLLMAQDTGAFPAATSTTTTTTTTVPNQRGRRTGNTSAASRFDDFAMQCSLLFSYILESYNPPSTASTDAAPTPLTKYCVPASPEILAQLLNEMSTLGRVATQLLSYYLTYLNENYNDIRDDQTKQRFLKTLLQQVSNTLVADMLLTVFLPNKPPAQPTDTCVSPLLLPGVASACVSNPVFVALLLAQRTEADYWFDWMGLVLFERNAGDGAKHMFDVADDRIVRKFITIKQAQSASSDKAALYQLLMVLSPKPTLYREYFLQAKRRLLTLSVAQHHALLRKCPGKVYFESLEKTYRQRPCLNTLLALDTLLTSSPLWTLPVTIATRGQASEAQRLVQAHRQITRTSVCEQLGTSAVRAALVNALTQSKVFVARCQLHYSGTLLVALAIADDNPYAFLIDVAWPAFKRQHSGLVKKYGKPTARAVTEHVIELLLSRFATSATVFRLLYLDVPSSRDTVCLAEFVTPTALRMTLKTPASDFSCAVAGRGIDCITQTQHALVKRHWQAFDTVALLFDVVFSNDASAQWLAWQLIEAQVASVAVDADFSNRNTWQALIDKLQLTVSSNNGGAAAASTPATPVNLTDSSPAHHQLRTMAVRRLLVLMTGRESVLAALIRKYKLTACSVEQCQQGLLKVIMAGLQADEVHRFLVRVHPQCVALCLHRLYPESLPVEVLDNLAVSLVAVQPVSIDRLVAVWQCYPHDEQSSLKDRFYQFIQRIDNASSTTPAHQSALKHFAYRVVCHLPTLTPQQKPILEECNQDEFEPLSSLMAILAAQSEVPLKVSPKYIFSLPGKASMLVQRKWLVRARECNAEILQAFAHYRAQGFCVLSKTHQWIDERGMLHPVIDDSVLRRLGLLHPVSAQVELAEVHFGSAHGALPAAVLLSAPSTSSTSGSAGSASRTSFASSSPLSTASLGTSRRASP